MRSHLLKQVILPSSVLGYFLQLVAGALLLVFYVEFLHHLFVIGLNCRWPDLKQADSPDTLRAIIASDPHILGRRFGSYIDRLRREWAMKRSYHAVYNLLSPRADVTFVLGDLTDEGEYVSDEREFEIYKQRFSSIFQPESYCPVISLVGNHDVGFHYKLFLDRLKMFNSQFISKGQEPTSSVRFIRLKSVEFVLLNSMAFEGDHAHCKLCNEARESMAKVKSQVTNPIVFQHFPLYRPNDLACPIDAHSAAEPLRSAATRQKLDVISQEASKDLLEQLKPRLIVSGHTHYSCKIRHGNVDEYSVPSFSWRNNIAPAIMLLVANSEDYAIETCPLAEETTVFSLYICGAVFLFSWSILRPLFMCILRKLYRLQESSKASQISLLQTNSDSKAKLI